MHLNAVTTTHGAVVVGNKVTSKSLRSTEHFYLRQKQGRPQLEMTADYVLSGDTENEFLQVVSSIVVVYAPDADAEVCELFHVDYEREKQDNYPEAHWQINAGSDAWAGAMGPKGKLVKLHLPVGGRRFRPSLEDGPVSDSRRDGRAGERRCWVLGGQP